MRQRRNINPLVFIIGASLLVALALILVYLLNRVSFETPSEKSLVPTPVGLLSEPDSEGWRPLFNGSSLHGWEITPFGTQGGIFVGSGKIIIGSGEDISGINWIKDFPRINYELSLEAMRAGGHDFFCGLTFPVNDQHCTFIVGGWGGDLVGLSNIDGMDASENFTGFRKHFDNNRWYKIGVKVDSLYISCFIDEERVVHIAIKEHSLSLRSEVLLSKPLGITSWRTSTALRYLKYRHV